MKIKLSLLISILLISSSFAFEVHFVLVADCHAMMEAWGPRNPGTLDAYYGGYPRAAYLIDSLRTEYPQAIILHAGDILTGDMLSQYSLGYAMYDLWLASGVEAFAIGNHEFDYGPQIFDSVLGEIDVPLVCANLDPQSFSNIASSIRPYRILRVTGDTPDDSLRIAIFGITTEETNQTGLAIPLSLSNYLDALDTFALPPGADVAIALTHLSIAQDLDIANLPLIQAVLGGHDHSSMLRWASDGTPVVKSDANIFSVGHLTMDYSPFGDFTLSDWEVIPVDITVPEAPEARARLDAYRNELSDYIGYDPYTDVVFTADSAIVYYPLAPDGSGWEDAPVADLVTDAYRWALGSQIAADGIASMRMPVFEGPVTKADLFRAMPVGLTRSRGLNAPLVMFNITGALLKQILEYTIHASLTTTPEAFPVFSGMRLSYNPDGALFNKVVTATWTIAGAPWSSSTTYRIGATTTLIQVMDMLGFPHGAVDTSETTAYEALVAYCSRPDFVPNYRSDGRIRNVVTGIEEKILRPQAAKIFASPNPFSQKCKISILDLASAQNPLINFEIKIYDLTGKVVDILKGPFNNSGNGNGVHIEWKPKGFLPTGVYFLKGAINGKSFSKKLVYTRN